MHQETRLLRERLAAADDAFDAAAAGDVPDCSAAMLAQTTSLGSYPAAAQAVYAVIPCDVDASDAEGSSATYVQRTGSVL